MSEILGVRVFGIATAVFLATLTVWLLSSLYILSIFEATFGTTISIVAGVLIISQLVKLSYRDFPEENNQ